MENSHHAPLYEYDELSKEETQQILTPFAFKIDKSLYGIALASPLKRGVALMIDLGLIALLSDTSGVFLALVIAITLYRLGNKKRAINKGKVKGHKRRAFMRGIAAFILFIVLLDVLPELYQQFSGEPIPSNHNITGIQLTNDNYSLVQAAVISKYTYDAIELVNSSDCEELACWQQQLIPFFTNSSKFMSEEGINININDVQEAVVSLAAKAQLNEQERKELVQTLLDSYQTAVKTSSQGNGRNSSFSANQHKKDTTIPSQGSGKDMNNKPVYSIVEWIKGVINDLGLGFGWAAFYFTVFTALWNGQTIGKKLLGIKVLQLDGTPLSLWDSFGRYGGYGAGIATGLLGFIQIYWDANRQAIHDKISSTVVIDVKKSAM